MNICYTQCFSFIEMSAESKIKINQNKKCNFWKHNLPDRTVKNNVFLRFALHRQTNMDCEFLQC